MTKAAKPRKAKSKAARTAKIRLHVQDHAGSLPMFRITRKKLDAALRARGLTGAVNVTFGATKAALERGLKDAEIVLGGVFETANLKARAPKLKWVQTIFAGVEKFAGLPKSIALTNASGVHAQKSGEFVIGALIMLNTAIPQFIALQRKKIWRETFTAALTGKTVVILGIGQIGSAAAQHAKYFGMNVIGVARCARKAKYFDRVVSQAGMDAVLPGADFFVVTLPGTAETRGCVGKTQIALLPSHAGVVNVGRGSVIDERALVKALRAGKLGGAVLDVFEREPLPKSSPVWHTPNVIVVPHCGIDDSARYADLALAIFIDNLLRYLGGKPLRNRVDLALGY